MSSAIDSLNRLSRKLEDSYAADTRYLAIARIGFALYILVFAVDYEWIASVPSLLLQPPPGPFAVVGLAPTATGMVVLEALRLALAVALLIGIRTVAVSVAMAIVLVIGGGLANSFGKVDHFILFEILPAVMALAGWGAAFSLDSRRETVSRPTRDNGAVILAWAAIVAFALFTAAVPKALRGWLDPARQATHGYIARDLADSVKLGPFGPELMEIKSALFWKALDYGTVVAEASLVVLIFFPIAFRIGIAVLVIFHIGVYLGLGIEFDSYAFVYFPFFAAPVMNLIRRVQSTRSKEYQDTSQTDIARASDGV